MIKGISYHNLMVHLSEYHGRTLAGHVARPHAMLYSVCGIRILFHNADAASRQRDYEGTIAEPVELATKRQSSI